MDNRQRSFDKKKDDRNRRHEDQGLYMDSLDSDFDENENRVEYRRNKKKDKHEKKHGEGKDNWDNPLCKYVNSDIPYDRSDMLNAMVKKNGLIIMINDLKKSRENNKKKPFYSHILVRDIIFAAALPEALEKICDKNEDIKKKDIEYLMDEILSFLNSSYDNNLMAKYDKESIDAMRNAYINILYKYNKKKVKKYKEIPNMDEAIAKQLVIITAGKNVRTSIYHLLKYFYTFDRKEHPDLELTANVIEKIFKVSYGKSNMNEVLKYVMLEKSNPQMFKNMPGSIDKLWDVSTELDTFMLTKLESLNRKELESVIKSFVQERRMQEKEYRIQRRFSRNTIHPDDYSKIISVCDSIEEKDFSVSRYLK